MSIYRHKVVLARCDLNWFQVGQCKHVQRCALQAAGKSKIQHLMLNSKRAYAAVISLLCSDSFTTFVAKQVITYKHLTFFAYSHYVSHVG